MADRREAIVRASLFSLGIALSGSLPAPVRAQGLFRPPPGAMLFSRKLIRELMDGKLIIAERQFQISFDPGDVGFKVRGSQTAVNVTVPPALEAFAEIERSRIENGLFPATLTPEGLIASVPAHTPSQATQQAVEKALALLDQSNSVSDPQAYRQFLGLVQQSVVKLLSRPPQDLFAPSSEPTTSRRQLPLPGDLLGEIEVSYRADADPQTGLLLTASRDVVTRIGDDTRRAREEWWLTPA